MSDEQEGLIDAAEFVFGSDDPVALSELADSFLAIDRMFSRTSRNGVRLAVTEIRQGSIIALLAPFLPMMGQILSAANTAVEVGDFVKRAKDALDAFAGIKAADETATSVDEDTATDLAELVKPITGRPDGFLGVAHIKYRSKTKERTVEVEATYTSAEVDRIAVNANRAIVDYQEAERAEKAAQDAPQLLRDVVLVLHQANSGPAKERGKTGDRAIVRTVSDQALPVYFVKTMNDMKKGMVGSTANPLRSSFMVDVIVAREGGTPKYYTVIEVHGPEKRRAGADETLSLLPGLDVPAIPVKNRPKKIARPSRE